MHTCRPAYPAVRQRLAAGLPRLPVAHERLGPWRERPPSPRAWYGFGARWQFTPRPLPPGSLPQPAIPGGKAIRTPLLDAADQPLHLRLPPSPKPLAPPSCQRPPARSLAPVAHDDLGPDTAIRVCSYASAPVRVSLPIRGDRRRFEAADDTLAKTVLAGTVGTRADRDTVARGTPQSSKRTRP